jgi:cytochrome c biogenesis protein CcmG/thiol:disulfide interchange protein DsbE
VGNTLWRVPDGVVTEAAVTKKRPVVPIVAVVVAVALVALLVYGVVHGGQNTTLDDAVKQGKHPNAPGYDLRRPVLNGSGQKSLADYRGQVVVLNFWASWCEPCRGEAPVLARAQAKLTTDHAGTVLGATYNDAPDDSAKFESEFKVAYPSLRDVGTELAQKYGTRALPETFVIDKQGRIVAISRGAVKQSWLDGAIAEAEKA